MLATPAWAKWHVAESENFVIYADDSEKDIARFATYLERYHAAMEFLTMREQASPSPSNRLTIFVVGGQKEIRNLAGTDSRTIAGFYTPRAGGSKAFVQDIRLGGGDTDWSMIILLHEYAHHFLMYSSRRAHPRWMNEGGAEFFASTVFMNDGSISIGRPAIHRAGELNYARDVPIEQLLDHELYEEKRGKRYDSFYGRSWLLYHYLYFSEDRKGQFPAYVRAIEQGKSSTEAAKIAFGDLDQLEKDLDRYLRKRRMMGYTLKPELLKVGAVAVRPLPEGEAAMMQVRIRSQRGVDREQALELIGEAREIAARYPQDPGVLTALAEAEYDAGNDDAAIAAADKAIALDPQRKNAYVQKGYALFRKAETASDADAAYQAAMKPFGALNKLENDHPLPLIYYYRSYAERGMEPPENAKHALERASELAPFDKGLTFEVAMMMAQEGKIELARLFLETVANDPHGGGMAERAKALRHSMAQAPEGEPYEPPVMVVPTVDVGNDEEDE